VNDDGTGGFNWFRNTAPYINAHRGRRFVLLIAGEVASEGALASVVHDIALLSSLGVQLVLVHGIRPQIEQRLAAAGIEARFHEGMRISDARTMDCVRDAAGAMRVEFEALLSMGLPNSPMQGADLRIASGNFVTGRPIGVLDGIDHHLTGRVRRIDREGINQQLASGAIVLLSPLGYSPTGEVFNLSMEDVAVQASVSLGAEKLILFGAESGVVDGAGRLVRQCAVEEIEGIDVPDRGQRALLETAGRACRQGVPRCHIISYRAQDALLRELFTHDGSGTLVTRRPYESSRQARIDDVGGILELIQPLEAEGVLLKRSREMLEREIGRFRVLERDGRIIACAALYPCPPDDCGEIACIVSHPDYRGEQRGQRLLRELEQEARGLGLNRVFVLTTQTAHWFIEQGFVESGRDALPDQRRDLYNLQRNSKVFFKDITPASGR
jgi:amino-acid N-acetyltransferase